MENKTMEAVYDGINSSINGRLLPLIGQANLYLQHTE
jgi:hypothetical protein